MELTNPINESSNLDRAILYGLWIFFSLFSFYFKRRLHMIDLPGVLPNKLYIKTRDFVRVFFSFGYCFIFLVTAGSIRLQLYNFDAYTNQKKNQQTKKEKKNFSEFHDFSTAK